MRKINSIIKRFFLQSVFFIWSIGILSLYFYDYRGYGNALVFSINFLVILLILSLLLLAVIIPFVYMVAPINQLLIALKRSPITIRPWREKIKLKYFSSQSISLPVLLIPFSLYVAALSWVGYILFISSDLSILGRNILTIFLTTLIVVIAFAVGSKLLGLFRYSFSGWLEKFVLSEAVGFGVLMIGMYFLGMAHLYYRSLVYSLIGVILIWCRKEIVELWEYLNTGKIEWNHRPLLSFKNFSFLAIGILTTIYMAGMFQQYPIGYDALIAYMTYPKEYALHHGIVNFPQWIYYGFPQYGEMLTTLGFLIFDFPLAVSLIFVFTLLTIMAVISLFKENQWRNSHIPILIYLSLPVISYQNTFDHKIEIQLAFYTFVTYHYFFQFIIFRKKSALFIFSFFAGIAAGIKYFFLLWYSLPIALFSIFYLFKKKIQFRELALSASIAALVFLPWPIRNFIHNGNPIDPILSEKFASEKSFFNALGDNTQKFIITETRNEAFLLWDDIENKNPFFFLTQLYNISMHNNKKYYSDGINLGITLLFSLPFLLIILLRKPSILSKNEPTSFFLLSTFIMFIGWIYIGHSVIWYAIPFLLFYSIIYGRMFAESKREERLLVYAVFCAWILALVPLQLNQRMNLANLQYPLTKSNDNLKIISDVINRDIPAGKKIWGADEPRGYFIKDSFERFIPDNYLMALAHLLRTNSEEHIINFLHQQNIQYFLFRGYGSSDLFSERIIWSRLPNGSERYSELTRENYRLFSDFRRNHLKMIYQQGEFFLYQLSD